MLSTVAKLLVAPGKGILAADESSGTIGKKLTGVGVESTEENRRAYRQLLFTSAGVEQYISGVILYDETIRQSDDHGKPFPQLLSDRGIVPGIKVDLGTKKMDNSPEETITQGLDGLDARLKEYYNLGARFAKWRAVIKITDTLPTAECVKINTTDLARYAKLCQDNNIVPIVEPEVLMTGNHSVERAYQVTAQVLKSLFVELKNANVDLSGLLLKPNMVSTGLDNPALAPAEVARQTLACFREAVPAAVAGIVFLSGGLTEQAACENLSAINQSKGNAPWPLSFSFGRALQNSAVKTWAGKAENVAAAQEAFIKRARLSSAAVRGEYSVEMEG